jgi:hypothetical protein
MYTTYVMKGGSKYIYYTALFQINTKINTNRQIYKGQGQTYFFAFSCGVITTVEEMFHCPYDPFVYKAQSVIFPSSRFFSKISRN